jgi:hypothetical protein
LTSHRFADVSIPGSFHGPGTDGYDAKQFFLANISRFDIFVLADADILQSDRSWATDYTMRPAGAFHQIISKQSALEPQAYVKESQNMLPVLNLKLLERYPIGSWENVVLTYYWAARNNRANFLISHGISLGNDRTMLEAGASALEGIISSRHYSDPFLFKRLGLAYSKLAAYDPGYKDKMKVQWQKYLDSNPPPNDPDLAEIRKALN